MSAGRRHLTFAAELPGSPSTSVQRETMVEIGRPGDTDVDLLPTVRSAPGGGKSSWWTRKRIIIVSVSAAAVLAIIIILSVTLPLTLGGSGASSSSVVASFVGGSSDVPSGLPDSGELPIEDWATGHLNTQFTLVENVNPATVFTTDQLTVVPQQTAVGVRSAEFTPRAEVGQLTYHTAGGAGVKASPMIYLIYWGTFQSSTRAYIDTLLFMMSSGSSYLSINDQLRSARGDTSPLCRC